MAIIDILTHYDAKKKAAHAAKTVKHGVSISAWFPLCSLLPVVQGPAQVHSFPRSCPVPSIAQVPCRGCAPAQSQSSQGPWQLTAPARLFCYPLGLLTDTCIMRILHKFFFCLKNASKTKVLNDDSSFNMKCLELKHLVSA